MSRTAYLAAVNADSPKALRECQDASGGAVDSVAGFDLTTVTGSPTYHAAGPMNDFGISFAAGALVSRAGPVSTVQANFSIEMLIKPVSVSGASRAYFYDGNGASNGWGVTTNTTSGSLTIKALAGGVGTLGAMVGGPVADQWNHVVIKRAASQWSYYLDGTLAPANAGTATPNVPSAGSTAINSSVGLACAYAYVAVYETALSDARVQAHFDAIAAQDLVFAPWLTTL
jgi:hypothetical protein